MAEPQIYAASEVAQNDPTMRNQKKDPKKVSTGAVDPLRSFENDARHLYPELMQWTSFKPEDREKKVDVIAKRPTAHRDLNYVIWRETQPDHTGAVTGSPDVAIKALRRLFAMKDPKVEKAA